MNRKFNSCWLWLLTGVCMKVLPSSIINRLTAKIFRSLEVVSRWRDPQLQVSENYSDLPKWRSIILKSCWSMSRFIISMFKSWYLFMLSDIYNYYCILCSRAIWKRQQYSIVFSWEHSSALYNYFQARLLQLFSAKSKPSKQGTLTQSRFTAGPSPTPPVQYLNNIGWTCVVFWECSHGILALKGSPLVCVQDQI